VRTAVAGAATKKVALPAYQAGSACALRLAPLRQGG
jgi:hypothetical protein